MSASSTRQRVARGLPHVTCRRRAARVSRTPCAHRFVVAVALTKRARNTVWARVGRVPLQPLEGYTVGSHRRPARLRTGRAAAPPRRTGARRTDHRHRLPRVRRTVARAPPTALVREPPDGAGDHHRHRDPGLDRSRAELGARPRAARRAGRRPRGRRAGPKAAAAAQALGLEVSATARDERMTGVRELLGEPATRRRTSRCSASATTPATPSRCCSGPTSGVTTVPVYRWQQPDDTRPAQALVRAVLDGRVHAVTFTSAPAVRNLFTIAEEDGAADELLTAMNTRTLAACVGPACAEAARAVGITEPLAPDVGRLGLMVRLLSERLQASRSVIELGGARRRDAGAGDARGRRARAAHLAGGRRVRRTRVERNGAVVSPSTLLRTVWGRAAADEHVVGVTVGRLRRKLGELGRLGAYRAPPRLPPRSRLRRPPRYQPASK